MKQRQINFDTLPKLGDRVYIPDLGIYGEVSQLSDRWRGLIVQIKHVGADGKVTFHEVADLTVQAVKVITATVKSNVFKRLWRWITGRKRI